MGYIDTDTHVIECEESWSYLDPSERQFRPVTMEIENPAGGPKKEVYLIGESLCRKFPTNGQGSGFGIEYTGAISHLEDPALRIKKMDALGVDVQIVISTNFIAAQLEDPYAEAALMRSWNRWMAELLHGFTDRMPWVMVCPSRSPERAIEEMRFCASHGAKGVMLKGVDHGYYLDSHYFDPIYKEAQDLNLTIVVHQGGAREHIEQLGITSHRASMAESMHSTGRTMRGFYAVLASDLGKRFPELRFIFVEAGAAWIPYIFHSRARNIATGDPNSFINTPDGPTRAEKNMDFRGELEERRIFASAEADEDIDYLSKKLGKGWLTIGSDMCHNDAGTDILAHTKIMRRDDIPDDVKLLVTDVNGRKAFDLPPDFRPSDLAREKAKAEVSLEVI